MKYVYIRQQNLYTYITYLIEESIKMYNNRDIKCKVLKTISMLHIDTLKKKN